MHAVWWFFWQFLMPFFSFVITSCFCMYDFLYVYNVIALMWFWFLSNCVFDCLSLYIIEWKKKYKINDPYKCITSQGCPFLLILYTTKKKLAYLHLIFFPVIFQRPTDTKFCYMKYSFDFFFPQHPFYIYMYFLLCSHDVWIESIIMWMHFINKFFFASHHYIDPKRKFCMHERYLFECHIMWGKKKVYFIFIT